MGTLAGDPRIERRTQAQVVLHSSVSATEVLSVSGRSRHQFVDGVQSSEGVGREGGWRWGKTKVGGWIGVCSLEVVWERQCQCMDASLLLILR